MCSSVTHHVPLKVHSTVLAVNSVFGSMAHDLTLNVVAQVLAVAGALAVLGLWTLSRRGKAKQAPVPSPDVPHEALSMGNGLGHRARARHSND